MIGASQSSDAPRAAGAPQGRICSLILAFGILALPPGDGFAQPPVADGPLTLVEQADRLAQKLFVAADEVQDYRMQMSKQQRWKGRLQLPEWIELVEQRKPRCLYMKWTGDLHRGREMIYCPDRYAGKLQVHDGGLFSFMSFSMDPDDSLLRSGQLHTAAEAGLFQEVALVRNDVDFRRANPGLPPPVISSEVIEGAPSTCIREESGAELFKIYHAGARMICLDDHSFLPTSLAVWNTDGDLMEQYAYSHIEINPGLTATDFDVHNPAYHF